MGEEFTYARAGVDIDRVKKAHGAIARMLRETFAARRGRLGEVLTEIGHYAGLIDMGRYALALHVDGVGTKPLLCQLMGRYDTIGVDCVAMCVNDTVCMGAEPIALVDYLVLQKADEEVVEEIMKGIVAGAKEARVAVVGGETAIHPDMLQGFDLSATCLGVVEKGRMVTGGSISAGDVVLGLASTGIHCNGLTLARKVLLPRYGLGERPEGLSRAVGDELLEPTRVYSELVLELLRSCAVGGLAHVTGGAFSKLTRLVRGRGLGFLLDNMPPPPPIFTLIQRAANLSPREAYRTFNMGVGFCVVTPEGESEKVIEVCRRFNVKAWAIGRVVAEEGVVIKTPGGVVDVA